MSELKTKFSIDDTVYHATKITAKKRHPCPDCLGSRKWKALSPAGGLYEFACPRCGGQYHGEHKLSLDYAEFASLVNMLTIGSARVNTSDEKPISYMCRETGVGSGNVYYEDTLFATRDEAMTAATAFAALANTNVPWVAKQYNETLKLSDYQMDNAVLKSARDEKATHHAKIEILFQDLRYAETMDDIKSVLDGFSLRDAS